MSNSRTYIILFLSVPYYEDQQLCEASALASRYQEELIQSPMELKQFFKSLVNLRSSLENKLKLQAASIAQMETSDESDVKKDILTGSNYLIQSEIDNISNVMSDSLHLAKNDVLKEQEGVGDEELLQYLLASLDLSNPIPIPNQDEDLDFGLEDDDVDSEWSFLTHDDDTESEIQEHTQGHQETEKNTHEFCEEEERQWDSLLTV